MEREAYTLFDILKATKWEREMVRGWMKKGYFTPTIQQATGPGRSQDTKNLFSRLDLYSVSLFHNLITEMKIPRAIAADISQGWRDDIEHWASVEKISDGELKLRLKTFNTLAITLMNGVYDWVAQDFLTDIQSQAYKKYMEPYLEDFPGIKSILEAADLMPMLKGKGYKQTQAKLQKMIEGKQYDPNWSWVLYLNFGRIREWVDQLFP